MTSVTLLGATGSIGTQALDVLAQQEEARVVALGAGGHRLRALAEQVLDHGVPWVAVAMGSAQQVREAVAAVAAERGRPAPELEVLAGPRAMTELAGAGSDIVLNAITGSIGLAPTLAALRAGSRLALANKESLVVGGPLVRRARRDPDQIVPVDSEHSAIAQALRAGRPAEVARIVLTASGGPFRGRSRAELAQVSAAEALAHPTWQMGPVITINSATMVNKGLELIEAHLLFDVPVADIDVVVHPQSMVHSMVEFTDGSTIAQASPPDMHLPIALALSWPRRPARPAVAPLRWDQPTSWTFEPLDEEAFGAVRLARQAIAASASHPAVLNAANEECVAAFRDGALSFLGITDTLEQVLAEHDGAPATLDLATLQQAERWARDRARELVARG